MITLSQDPQVAEQQIEAIIFYLTTCGYIDSEFDLSEKAFVRAYLRKVVSARIDARHGEELDPEARFEAIEREHEHYVEVFQQIDREVKELFTEAVADGEDVGEFVRSKLKLRAFEMFKDLDMANRGALLGVVDEFINLIQAQRDYFGAHTYERVDKSRGEFFHTNWTGRGGDTASSSYNA